MKRKNSNKHINSLILQYKNKEINFSEIEKQFRKLIFSIIYKKNLYIEGYEKEDFYQELIITVYKCILGFDETKGKDFLPYCYRAMIRRIHVLLSRSNTLANKSHLESVSLDKPIPEKENSSLKEFIPAYNLDSSFIVENKDMWQWMEKEARSSLSEREQEFLKVLLKGGDPYKHFQEYSYNSIGGSLYNLRKKMKRLKIKYEKEK